MVMQRGLSDQRKNSPNVRQHIYYSLTIKLAGKKSAALGMAITAGQVVVDHSCRLHEGVADCRTDELEAAFLEGLAHGIRFGRCGGNVFEAFPMVADGSTVNKLPDVGIERAEFSLDIQEGAGVSHGGLYFKPVADDAGVIEQ